MAGVQLSSFFMTMEWNSRKGESLQKTTDDGGFKEKETKLIPLCLEYIVREPFLKTGTIINSLQDEDTLRVQIAEDAIKSTTHLQEDQESVYFV